MANYSRQREAIRHFLIGRYDHPTADTIYEGLRADYPNLSLGTVYRNLAQLSSTGEILKISSGIGPDRYDGNTSPHYHFFCRSCGCVDDIHMDSIDHINTLAGASYDGKIEGNITYFYGLCSNCVSTH